MKSNVSSPGEPLWTVAGITAAVTAVLGLLTAFGVDLTKEQITAILGVAAVAAPLIVAWLSRGKVVPYDNVVALHNKNDDVVAGPASVVADGELVDVQAA